MENRIREMVEQDVDEVVAIITAHHPVDGECFESYYKNYFSDPQRIESSDEKNFVILEESTGNVVGVSGFTPDQYKTPKIYWLSWTYVSENYRRCGRGSALLDHVINQVKARGARKLYIDTSSHPLYESALRLYTCFGFQVEGSLKDYYGEGENCVILGKSL